MIHGYFSPCVSPWTDLSQRSPKEMNLNAKIFALILSAANMKIFMKCTEPGFEPST